MQNIIYFFKNYGKDIILYVLICICLGLAIYDIFIKEEQDNTNVSEVALLNNSVEEKNDEEVKEETETLINVDIKGAVKKPGVYQVKNSQIINDVVTLAGGFTSSAYKNGLNLSKKVSDEMVIYVYTQSEIKSREKATETKATNTPATSTNTTCEVPSYDICECVKETESIITPNENISTESNNNNENSNSTTENSSKVNINQASASELTTLSGIGESKAKAIIEYRTQNGNFKSIEEIKNVSGIGDSVFEKIKDHITV